MHAVDRFFLLEWAGSREHVLRILDALREADYDEQACRYIEAIIRPRKLMDEPPPAAVLEPTAPETIYTKPVVSYVDYSQQVRLPPLSFGGPQIVEPEGNCDGSREYAYDRTNDDGRGAKLAERCPGCRACS